MNYRTTSERECFVVLNIIEFLNPKVQYLINNYFAIIKLYLKLTNSMAYGTCRFNAAFTRALQYFQSWAESTQFHALIPISSRSILILSSHLRQGLPKSFFPVGLPVKILKELLPSDLNSNCQLPKPGDKCNFNTHKTCWKCCYNNERPTGQKQPTVRWKVGGK